MHVMELDKAERENYEKAMEVIRALTDDERTAMLEHAAAAVACFSATRDLGGLEDWAKSFQLTMRVHRSQSFAVAGGNPATFRVKAAAVESARPEPDLRLAATQVWRAMRGAIKAFRFRHPA